MKKESKAYAIYWRNNLTDVALQGGGFEPPEKIAIDIQDWQAGKLQQKTVTALFEKVDARKTDGQDLNPSVEILAYAKAYARIIQHGRSKKDGIPDHLSTVMLRASVARDGALSATSTPYIARTLLEPLEFSKFFIGTMDDFDSYTSGQGWGANASWDEQISRCDSLEQAVCDLGYLATENFRLQDKVYLVVIDANAMGANAPLIKLYDAMRSDVETDMPLFDSYATGRPQADRTVPETGTTVTVRTGHMEPAYPLADAQRDALSVAITSGPGEIVAVNGPPGTGKTTLLQSIVASLWTSAVLEGKETPPVIVASSTNNQAVTNVIDSFGKVADRPGDVLAGRWLPDLVSYGCYYPADSKVDEARGNGYQIEEMWARVESQDYLDRAEKAYLDVASRALGIECKKVNEITEELQKRLRGEHGKLVGAVEDWAKLTAAWNSVLKILGEDPGQRLNVMANEAQQARQERDEIKVVLDKFDQYVVDEPIWMPLLSWIPPIAKKRVAQLRRELKLDAILWPQTSIDEIETVIRQTLVLSDRVASETENTYKTAQATMKRLQSSKADWLARAGTLGLTGNTNINDYDLAADTSIRQAMFKLATHYWEGRWLIEMRQLLLSGEIAKRGKKHVEARWRRRAMLTPCSVSTLYRLPRLFSATRKTDNEWQDVPLYNFIDLLIVDEAGQVGPSVAGPAFALSAKAVVVGDTEQIAPVGNCDKASDAGNLREAGVALSYQDAEETGRTAHTGSVMKVAQTASHFHYDKDLDRGMMLYEHRRCVDDIIKFCNDLCYKGKLVPMRGNAQVGEHGLPRMGYVHVPGQSEMDGKSRVNRMEAEAVVDFVVEHAQALEAAYPGNPLNELIAIVTPFSRQAELIERGLKKVGLGGITVGTVHRMQGAEYRVVLLSPVYARHDASRYMLDGHPYILNVAVSRAQDSFIVISDMDAFDENGHTPSALLTRHLFASNGGMKPWSRKAVEPLMGGEEINLLTTQELHDAFLSEALATTQREIVIVSPWISGSVIDFTGLAQKIAEATRRNVKVRIYTDERFNRDGESLKENALKAKQQLTSAGAEVTFVRRIHNKDVFIDETTLCRGSFNWLSVFRVKGEAQQLDASILYAGRKVKDEKACMLGLLEKRLVRVG